MTNFGKITDAIKSGQKALNRTEPGIVATTAFDFADLTFNNVDFSQASFLDAKKRDAQFIWGISKWGNTKDKVTK